MLMSQDEEKKEESRSGSTDIGARLLEERMICLNGDVSDESAGEIIAQLLYLATKDPEKPIKFFINSPGGAVTAGMAIFDMMKFVSPPVHTICIGQAASMGAVLLMAGEPGHRQALPNVRIMIHQPMGGAIGRATEIQIQAREILRVKQTLNEIIANATGQPLEKIKTDTERDTFMTASEALAYGIVDRIVTSSSECN